MASIGVIGKGVVGDRIARRLPSVAPQHDLIAIDARSIRSLPDGIDVAILAQAGEHAEMAADLVGRGVAVVSVSDDLGDVRALTDLDQLAVANDAALVVGAGMSPGLTDLLARLLASELASCDEIHLSIHGTAGPACARQQHDALRGVTVGYHDGRWIQRPAGSGRELCYFPEPVGPYDCYRAELASPVLLHESFPDVDRISARVSANRRDRFTAWLPMLSPPHREGGIGAVRVEVRGADAAGGRRTLIAGVAELVGTSTAAVAMAFAVECARGALAPGVVRAGDSSIDTVRLLNTVSQAGVRLQRFTGVPWERRISANP